MQFLIDHALYFLLGIAAVFTFFWLYAFRKRLRAKWYALLIISALHIVLGVASVKLFAFLEAPGGGFKGAMSLYGAVFFMPLLYFLGAKIFRRDMRTVFDLLTVPLLFTLACARVNCLFAGCCKGLIIPFIHSHTVRWPTRETELVFYAVFLTFAIIGVIKNKTNGTLYPLYMIAYGIFRFVIEWFRVTEHAVGPFHVSHFWSLLALIIGASVYFEIHNKSKKKRSKQHV